MFMNFVMKTLKVCLILFLFAGLYASAQVTPRLLEFESSAIGLDTVRYDGGPVKVRFTCRNISAKNVSIIEVSSQCGCTKPSFSRMPVKPGGKTYVDVLFDPADLFAWQTRHLTVIATNGDYRKFSTITVHAYVERDITEEELRYPYELFTGLRSDMQTVGMRRSKRGEMSVKEFTVYNSSDVTLDLSWSADRRRVRAELPDSLYPGQSAKVKVSVSTKLMRSGPYEFILKILSSDGTDTACIALKGSVM